MRKNASRGGILFRVFLTAIQETDRRLSLSARPPYRLQLKCSAEKDTDLLDEGLKVIRKLTARISKLLEEKKKEEPVEVEALTEDTKKKKNERLLSRLKTG